MKKEKLKIKPQGPDRNEKEFLTGSFADKMKMMMHLNKRSERYKESPAKKDEKDEADEDLSDDDVYEEQDVRYAYLTFRSMEGRDLIMQAYDVDQFTKIFL